MTDSNPIFRAHTLETMLSEAKEYVLRCGLRRESSRGTTYSVNALTLVWQSPSEQPENHWSWPKEEADFYQRVFVSNKPENRPERLAERGDLLFPYTYAARSRFWDGGWGYALAVLRAVQTLKKEPAVFLKNEDTFFSWLVQAGELVHLQSLLSVFGWLGRDILTRFSSSDLSPVEAFIQQTRADQLERIITEIAENPASRRAVTVSFVHPHLDQRMQPLLGIPPYQFFQLLPAERYEPLHSFHVHRSLDAGQGVQLDFMHDFHWLTEAANRLNRPLGEITITAGDFHVYIPSEKAPAVDHVKNWLLDVTDGYTSGTGQPSKLLQKDNYRHNALRIYQLLGEER